MKYFETENSVYFMDDENKRYRRQARNETNEQIVHSHRLGYQVWHLLQEIDTPYWEENGRLRIMEESSVIGIITSPIINQGDAKDFIS